jgi:metallo-beta-lactamase class B
VVKFMKRAAVALLLVAAHAQAQSPPDWTAPQAPFRIAGNLYYVGSQGLASYLIATPRGNILINSSLEQSVPLIRASVEQLKFRWADTKVLLISHAHWDHDAGSAEILRETGAKYEVMDADVSVVESGGKADFAYFDHTYPVAHVDRTLHDGDRVTLGGTVLIAHKTPGHTRGCTTWTLQVKDAGRVLNAVIVGSWNVNPGFRLVDQAHGPIASYPGIAADYRHTFEVLRALPCDLFLGAHGEYFGMAEKLQRRQGTPGAAVWIDPDGYRAAVAERAAAFEAELKRQQAAGG